MITEQEWIGHLLDTVRRVADAEYQRKVWLEGSLTGDFGTFGEECCRFFDDFYALKVLTAQLATISAEQAEALRKFTRAFSWYSWDHSKVKDDSIIVDDPEWERVREIARDTLAVFNSGPADV